MKAITSRGEFIANAAAAGLIALFVLAAALALASPDAAQTPGNLIEESIHSLNITPAKGL